MLAVDTTSQCDDQVRDAVDLSAHVDDHKRVTFGVDGERGDRAERAAGDVHNVDSQSPSSSYQTPAVSACEA